MERTRLKKARLERGLTQPQLATEIGYSKEAISLWERGEATPHNHAILVLCKLFDKNPSALDLASDLSESELAMIEDLLKNRKADRRQAIKIMALPAFAGIDFSALSNPLVPPEAFLRSCRASIDGCWHLLDHNGYAAADTILAECVPTLSGLATHSPDYRHLAASLATEAKILQGNIAMHRLNYTREETLFREAVHFGELSGDERLHAEALGNLGWLYRSHRQLPEKGIHFYNLALTHLDSNALLQRGDMYMSLSAAHAQAGDKDRAIEMLKQAKLTLPTHPELDPLYRLIDIGPLEIARLEGQIYLYLEKSFPNQGYAQKAYDTFRQGASRQAIADRSWSEMLIRKAEAALVLDDLHEFAQCLKRGLIIAIQIDSQKRKDEAIKVLTKAPEAWKQEKKYQDLARMF